jgi:uncharacterized protein (DUF1778 family)
LYGRSRRLLSWEPESEELDVATSATTQNDRIELRPTKEERRNLVAAAAHEGLDVESFVMQAALAVAREVVHRSERFVLSARDTARILDLLENPPKPTPTLLAAACRLRRK